MNSSELIISDPIVSTGLYQPTAPQIIPLDAPLIDNQGIPDQNIIIDLDETVVSTKADGNIRKVLQEPDTLDLRCRYYQFDLLDVMQTDLPGTGKAYQVAGFTRPGTPEFLKYCFTRFRTVAVWSAGQDQYVKHMVDFLFRDLPRPDVVFSWPECQTLPSGNYHKPIRHMSKNKTNIRSPITLTNTFALDDRLDTFGIENPQNGILIPAYQPQYTKESLRQNDPALYQLIHWLELPEVKNSKDIRTLDKSRIFKQKMKLPSQYIHYC